MDFFGGESRGNILLTVDSHLSSVKKFKPDVVAHTSSSRAQKPEAEGS
jgi:hypothetical protein